SLHLPCSHSPLYLHVARAAIRISISAGLSQPATLAPCLAVRRHAYPTGTPHRVRDLLVRREPDRVRRIIRRRGGRTIRHRKRSPAQHPAPPPAALCGGLGCHQSPTLFASVK